MFKDEEYLLQHAYDGLMFGTFKNFELQISQDESYFEYIRVNNFLQLNRKRILVYMSDSS